MAQLDFPNAPTVGATYTAPNGAVYTWDGAAWTVSGVLSTGSAAGGDLSGTYPNPVVAAAAITAAKLAPGATVRQVKWAALNINSVINTVAFSDVITVSITTTGGAVVLLAMAAWYGQAPVNAAINVSIGIGRDTGASANILAVAQQINVQGTAGQIVGVPLTSLVAIDQPSAAAHVYHLIAAVPNTNCYVATPPLNPGIFWAIELG